MGTYFKCVEGIISYHGFIKESRRRCECGMKMVGKSRSGAERPKLK